MANARSEARLEVLLAVKRKLSRACFDDDSLSEGHVEVLANLLCALEDAVLAEVDVLSGYRR